MLTAAQVAAHFNVATKTVLGWAAPSRPSFKRLECVRLSSRCIRFTEAQIEDFKMRRSGLSPWEYRQRHNQTTHNSTR